MHDPEYGSRSLLAPEEFSDTRRRSKQFGLASPFPFTRSHPPETDRMLCRQASLADFKGSAIHQPELLPVSSPSGPYVASLLTSHWMDLHHFTIITPSPDLPGKDDVSVAHTQQRQWVEDILQPAPVTTGQARLHASGDALCICVTHDSVSGYT
jgi:hypothetical protein